MSKQDKLYKDAMETAAVSNETAVAEELLSYFVDIGNKDCFAAMLYICFDLLRPDVVAELVSPGSTQLPLELLRIFPSRFSPGGTA